MLAVVAAVYSFDFTKGVSPMPPLFNAADYASVPKVNAANAVPIVRKLLVLTPKGAPESVRVPARAMRAHAEALRTSRLARRKQQKPANRRTVDQFADASMGRLFRRIEEYANLPAERHPLAPRAAEILALLFPERLTFTQGDMDTQWNVTDEMLNTIESEGLGDDLDRIAGPEFLSEVRLAHEAYGKVLGISKAVAVARPDGAANHLDLLAALSSAMGEYAFQLAALASSSASAEPLRAAARAALAPLDELRATAAARKAGAVIDDGGDEDDKPLPDAPTG
jgi:hypothetical protein